MTKVEQWGCDCYVESMENKLKKLSYDGIDLAK